MGLVPLQEDSGDRDLVLQLGLRTLNQELVAIIMLLCSIGQVN